MKSCFIYASDYSGSTHGDAYYNDNGSKTLEYFKENVNKHMNSFKEDEVKVVYLQWGADCVHVGEETIAETYRNRSGNSGDTRPQAIIEWIKKHLDLETFNIKLLYIVTDGCISVNNVNSCIKLNAEMMYDKVVFYAYNLSLRQIDLSVAASFFKKECVVIRNNDVMDEVNIAEDFDYNKITLGNFEIDKNALMSYIRFKFISSTKSNRRALDEIDKLKNLRNRLFDEINSNKISNGSFKDVKDKDTFINLFKNTEYYINLNDNKKVNIEKCISTLINYLTNDKKSYEFDALKYVTTYNAVEDEEPEFDVDFANEEKVEFPDIITFDDSKNIPVIILAIYNLPGKMIFHTDNNLPAPASFSKFKRITECPLFILNDKDFVDNSICYFYTLDVYKQLLQTELDSEIKSDPHTRRSYSGGIIPAPEFDQYNDYIVAKSYFDSKKVNYNKGLFYYVLWKICDSKEWMNRNVVDKMKQYVMRRVAETDCFIGLSSLPLDPRIKTSLPAALWYCTEISSYIFKDDDEHFTKERLQMYHGVANYMMDILAWFDYPLNIAFINSRVDILKYVTILKRIPTMREKYRYVACKIFKEIDGFLINEIVQPNNVQKLNYIQLNHKKKLNEAVLNNEVKLDSFVHFLDVEDCDVEESQICRDTMRPYFILIDDDKVKKSFYSELLIKLKKVVIEKSDEDSIKINYKPADALDFQRIVSLYKLYINCVKENARFPSRDEYRDFVLKNKMFCKNLPVIFASNIFCNIDYVYSKYQEAIQGIDVTEFTSRSDNSVNRLRRVKKEIENKDLFKTDSEINEFILKEENLYIKR